MSTLLIFLFVTTINFSVPIMNDETAIQITVLIPTKSPSVENITQHVCSAQQSLQMILYNITQPLDTNTQNIWEETTQKFVEFFYNNDFDSVTESGIYSIKDSSVHLFDQSFVYEYDAIDMPPVIPSIVLSYEHEGTFVADESCDDGWFPVFRSPFNDPRKRDSYVTMLQSRKADAQLFDNIGGVGEVIDFGSGSKQFVKTIPNVYMSFSPMREPFDLSESLMVFMSMKEFVESYYKENNIFGAQVLSKLTTVPFWKDGNNSLDSQNLHLNAIGLTELTIAYRQFFSYNLNFGRFDTAELALLPFNNTRDNQNSFLAFLKQRNVDIFADVTEMTVSFQTSITKDSWSILEGETESERDVISDDDGDKSYTTILSVTLGCAVFIFLLGCIYETFLRKPEVDVYENSVLEY